MEKDPRGGRQDRETAAGVVTPGVPVPARDQKPGARKVPANNRIVAGALPVMRKIDIAHHGKDRMGNVFVRRIRCQHQVVKMVMVEGRVCLAVVEEIPIPAGARKVVRAEVKAVARVKGQAASPER